MAPSLGEAALAHCGLVSPPLEPRSWCQPMGAEAESEILMQSLLFQLDASEPCSAAGPNLEAQM